VRESADELPEYPRLRRLMILPVRDGERELLVVSDPMGIMPGQSVLGIEALAILQLLDGTVSRGAALAVMPFLEAVSEGLPPERIDALLPDATSVRAHPTEALLHDADWWPRALALHVLGRDDEVTTPGRSLDDVAEEDPGRGQALFSGTGVGSEYGGPTWDDRGCWPPAPRSCSSRSRRAACCARRGSPRVRSRSRCASGPFRQTTTRWWTRARRRGTAHAP